MNPKLMLFCFVLLGGAFAYQSIESFQRGKTLLGGIQLAAGVAFWIRGWVDWRKSAGG